MCVLISAVDVEYTQRNTDRKSIEHSLYHRHKHLRRAFPLQEEGYRVKESACVMFEVPKTVQMAKNVIR